MAHSRKFRQLRQRAAYACIAIGVSACASSFFQLSPTGEDGAAAPAKKPATTAAKPATDSAKPKPVAPRPVVEKPAPKVVEKPAAKAPEKVAEKPASNAARDSAKTVAPKPVAAAVPKVADVAKSTSAPPAAPPIMRRPEPIIEPPAVEPTPGGSDSTGVALLMHAAAVWDAVRLFHPTASTERAVWDNITVRRLTDVRTAKSPQQYANVMSEWLGRLNDPVTRIMLASEAPPAEPNRTDGAVSASVALSPNVVAPARGKKATPARDTTVVVTWPVGRAANDSAAWSAMRDATRNLQSALHVVLDLRGGLGGVRQTNNAAVRALQTDVANNVATVPAFGPAIRRRVYEGWPDERTISTSSFGSAAWRVSDAMAIVTGSGFQFSTMRSVAIIADSATSLPAALLALVSTKQATLIAEGFLSDASLVPTTTIAIGNGLVARIRTGELLNTDGSVGIRPDTTVFASASSDSAAALKVAIRVANGTLAPRAAMQSPFVNSDAVLAASAWNTQHYPIMGARLLSAFKVYSTLKTFHAYSELHDEDLDEVFARIIPRVEAARDADTYAAAMLDFVTTADDAQAVLSGPSVTQRIGAAAVPFRVRWIENRAIVTQLASGSAGSASGLAIGDEISATDGYPMAAYTSEHRRYGAASNDWSRTRNIMDMIPRGPAGDAIFRARDANNRERTLTLQRNSEFASAFSATERSATAAVREVGAGIGYIDLDRVTEQSVDSALNALSNARAIIFDARVSRALSPAMLSRIVRRVALQPRTVVSKQALRIATEPCVNAVFATSTCAVERRVSDGIAVADTAQHYRGRVVVLIDERTQGALERFGLAMESAANAVFIGSPSAGASGDISAIMLPGQLMMTFSGSEVRHADGRQLQRVGLTPQVEAHPTVKGVRAGADETLDAAQKWVQQQLNPVPAKRPK